MRKTFSAILKETATFVLWQCEGRPGVAPREIDFYKQRFKIWQSHLVQGIRWDRHVSSLRFGLENVKRSLKPSYMYVFLNIYIYYQTIMSPGERVQLRRYITGRKCYEKTHAQQRLKSVKQ